jgi:fructoselysine-6-P-deglycase FrlB-like protein
MATAPTAGAEPGALMRAEMHEQPRRLAELAARRDELAREVRAVLPPRLAGTILVGGSSDHAAQVGRYLIEMSRGRPVSLGPSP